MKELSQDECRNVVKCLEVFSDDEMYYLVTEYMPKGDLAEYCRRCDSWPLPEEEAKSIIKQMATGLSDLHERRILHRDIKLENILVGTSDSKETTVKLADFGSAVRLSGDVDSETFRIGTPCYMAPEIIQGQRYGLKADIWSLGVVLHLILSSSFPFYHKDIVQIKKLTVQAELDLEKDSYLSKMSAEAKNLIEGMLTKDPKKRLSIQQVLSHPWMC